ncbi:MAG: glycosyltransferase family 2 protein [Candidatus Doudnabacteria bacterium]
MDYKKISIIIPVYNELATIQELLTQVQLAGSGGLEKEIILVDDHSTDGTTEFVRKLQDPQITVFVHDINQGKGGALHTGFQHATGDIIVIQDADLEYDPAEIENVLAPFWKLKAEVVYGSRYLKENPDLLFWHSFFNKAFTRFGNLFTGQNITDIMTCYKAFSRKALSSVLDKLESKRFGFEPEVTARLSKLGYKIIEVPISYAPRSKGEGKHMNFKGQTESLWALIKYSLMVK